MSEKIKQVQEKANEAGHAIDDFVEKKSEKHGFTKFQVWVGLAIGALAIVGAAKLMGWI